MPLGDRLALVSGWCWGDRFRLTGDQNAKTRFDNDQTGYRIATGVRGSNTGEGGDIVVVDDPHNVKEKESRKKVEETLMWWDEVMSTRLNDPRTGAKVIVMQRISEGDLSGRKLKQGGYEHLCLPAEFEPERRMRHVARLGRPAHDPGRPPLGPEDRRRGNRRLEGAPRRPGCAGQFQQRPAPAGAPVQAGMVPLFHARRRVLLPAQPDRRPQACSYRRL